jgi:hypothetical protein
MKIDDRSDYARPSAARVAKMRLKGNGKYPVAAAVATAGAIAAAQPDYAQIVGAIGSLIVALIPLFTGRK